MNFTPIVLTGGTTSIYIMVAYIAIFAGLIYFLSVRPNRNRQKKLDAMIASLETGDSILTTSGFYGVVIDVTDDTVIVEFGNNKNCRIPMQKTAITQVEKPEDAAAAE